MESLLELLILRLLIVVQVYVFREKKKVASFSGSILDGKSKLTNQDLLCDVHRFMSSAINLSTLSCKPEAFLTYPARGSDI